MIKFTVQCKWIELQVRRTAPGQRLSDHLSIGGQIEILEVMIKEQEIQTTDWLEEQTCANRILLTTASQHPVMNEEQARYAKGRTVVNQLCNGTPVPLRELLQMPLAPKGARHPFLHPKMSRQQRSECLRTPSIHNPWDRPSGIVKTSQAGWIWFILILVFGGQNIHAEFWWILQWFAGGFKGQSLPYSQSGVTHRWNTWNLWICSLTLSWVGNSTWLFAIRVLCSPLMPFNQLVGVFDNSGTTWRCDAITFKKLLSSSFPLIERTNGAAPTRNDTQSAGREKEYCTKSVLGAWYSRPQVWTATRSGWLG